LWSTLFQRYKFVFFKFFLLLYFALKCIMNDTLIKILQVGASSEWKKLFLLKKFNTKMKTFYIVLKNLSLFFMSFFLCIFKYYRQSYKKKLEIFYKRKVCHSKFENFEELGVVCGIWNVFFKCKINFCNISPWSDDLILMVFQNMAFFYCLKFCNLPKWQQVL
jgi:hypothetical protein